ncbi:MAG: hypothetical protein U0522_01630 [Candidatus Paceibacterota bacterium]
MNTVAVLICAFLFGGGFDHVLLETRYRVTDLGVLPEHQSSRAFSVNNRSVVVGESTQGFLTQHAFVWKIGSSMRDYMDFGVGQTVALGVSDCGYVTGTHSGVDGVSHGWIWRGGQTRGQGEKLFDLGTLGGNFCAPYAVNDNGVVVGVSHNADYKNHAFLWRDGVMNDLFPQYDFSVATDINEAGQSCGFFQDVSGASVAFLRSTDGQTLELGTLGGDHSVALGLCDLVSGENHPRVVGSSYLSTGHRHAFLFENGEMCDLGTLENDRDGNDTTSEAFEINNHGVVIGESVSLGAPARAFVWSRAEGMRDLQSLILCPTGAPTSRTPPTFHLERVSDINDSGQIVGWGYFGEIDGDGNKPPTHAVILTPISCPQALHNFSTKETK